MKEPALALKQALAQCPAMPCATGSEPAFAGGIWRTGFALAVAYRVFPSDHKSPIFGVGSERKVASPT
jgi:hypothetical protein